MGYSQFQECFAHIAKIEGIALRILSRWENGTATLDYILSRELRDCDLSRPDRSRLTDWVFTWGRNRGTARHLLDCTLTEGINSIPPILRRRLELSVCRILQEERTPKPVIVAETVERVRKNHGEGLAKLTNAVLRQILIRPIGRAETVDICTHLANTTSHPLWMVQRWMDRWGEEKTRALLEWNNHRAEINLRWNRLRGDIQAARAALTSREIEFAEIPDFEGFFLLKSHFYPGAAQLVASGDFSVMNPSASLSVRLLDPQPGERVLDLCSAPGGKTTFIAELMGDRGEILAVDVSPSRLRLVSESLERLKLTSVHPFAADGRTLEVSLPQPESEGLFDRVLVDAPCSGFGVLSRRADLRWRRKQEDFDDLIPLQQALLNSGANQTRPGGVLVYSTCTIEPEENEAIVEDFLLKRTDFILEDQREKIAERFFTGMGMVGTFSPRDNIDGVFAARMTRKLTVT
ncbi:MAG: 16S rRNA (cytosine(967)-C(5))-methyltransferase RsmB [bacterium]|nr:16S rRNA (cytosine(967)-C(5))-methyltransferase RsmB [bacterium]